MAADVPFLSDFARALQLTDADPYGELIRYFGRYRDRVEQTMGVLAYFDGVNLAKQATAPALFAVGLLDYICPPSTVFASFNSWASDDKEIVVYPYNGHGSGAEFHMPRRLEFLAQHLA